MRTLDEIYWQNELKLAAQVESMIELFMTSGAFMRDLSLVREHQPFHIFDAKIVGDRASFKVTFNQPFRIR